MNITVEQTMEMPDVVLFARKLDAALKAEQKKRQQFYESIHEDVKSEFINGEVYFESTAKYWHTQIVANLSAMLVAYVRPRQLGTIATEKLLVSLTRNDYEPDLCFFKNEKAIEFTRDQMQFPAPDLVVEVLSGSTEHRDRGVKFDDYAAHGVEEYWIIDPDSETVEQYRLADSGYQLVIKAAEGLIKSIAIEGFGIPIRAIFDEKLIKEVLKKLID